MKSVLKKCENTLLFFFDMIECEGRSWGENKVNNKRNMKRIDPFMPVKFSNALKSKTAEKLDIDSLNFNNNPFEFMTSSDTFRIDVPTVKKGLIVLLTKKSIGTDNELGVRLMKDFVVSLADLVMLPQYVIVMNEAIYLLNDQNVKDSVLRLQKYGVSFLISDETAKYFCEVEKFKGIKQVAFADITEKIMYSERLINM